MHTARHLDLQSHAKHSLFHCNALECSTQGANGFGTANHLLSANAAPRRPTEHMSNEVLPAPLHKGKHT